MEKEFENDEGLDSLFDPGMYVTWLVKDIDKFPLKPSPTSEQDRFLSFGLTYQEWLALYFDVLGANNTNYEKIKNTPSLSPFVEKLVKNKVSKIRADAARTSLEHLLFWSQQYEYFINDFYNAST